MRRADGPARRQTGPVPGLLRLSQVQEHQGRGRARQSHEADRHGGELRQVRFADGGAARPAWPVSGLQCLPQVPQPEVTETCPECGAPMKLRPGRRGFFLGCSKYPKCKGTREASAELLEQIQTPAAV